MSFLRSHKKSRSTKKVRWIDEECRRSSSNEDRCQRPGCSNRPGWSKVDGARFYALYCNDHACQLGPQRCRRMKRRDEIYCPEHATCTAEGCLATPDRLSLKTLPWFCNTHNCVYPGCADFGQYGGYCVAHVSRCAFGGCPSQQWMASRFCEFHTNNAGPQAPVHGTMYEQPPLAAMPPPPPPAGTHLCDAECTEHRHSNKALRPESFCRMPGCSRLRHTKEGGESDWCQQHTCETYLCLRKRSDRQPSMKTCERHSCAVDRCDYAAQSHSTFCRRHGCEADNCTKYKEAQDWFCGEHECQRPRCAHKAAAGAGYCQRHLEEREHRMKEHKYESRSSSRSSSSSSSSSSSIEGRGRDRMRCDPPLVVIHDHSGQQGWRGRSPLLSPSPVCRRSRSREIYPDCLDDARAGRERRGYYDRAPSRYRRPAWDY